VLICTTFTDSLPDFRLSSSGSVLDATPHGRGFDPACANIFLLLNFTFYSLVFIVLCDLFSLTFILITMSTSCVKLHY